MKLLIDQEDRHLASAQLIPTSDAFVRFQALADLGFDIGVQLSRSSRHVA